MMSHFENLNDYLTGEAFSSGLSIKWDFADRRGLTSRQAYLSELCRDRRVIHLGFLDHNMDTIRRKMASHTWLHQILMQSASSCLGIDIHPELVAEVKSELGIDDAICSDISTDAIRPEITSQQWDYLVCGEIIEHVDNPVAFLSAIRNRYMSYIKQIIVTVPNSLSLGFVKNAFRNAESINTDHRYSFTPYNISKILVISGYRPVNIGMVLHFDPKTRGLFHRMILKKFPLLRSDIIVEATF